MRSSLFTTVSYLIAGRNLCSSSVKVYRLVDLMESYPGLPPQLQFLLSVLKDFPGGLLPQFSD